MTRKLSFAFLLRPLFGAVALRLLVLTGITSLVTGLALAPTARAVPFQLIDGNSVVGGDTMNTFDPQTVTSWVVDGVDQLYQQGFWYRVGATQESKVSTLPVLLEGTTDTNFDLLDDTLFVRYGGAGFDLEVRLTLDGGAVGSGASDLGEQISITNTGLSPLDFHFFQYTDFDLLGSSSGDEAVFMNANAVQQYEGLANLTETVVTPSASHRQIDFYPTILNSLNDGVATTLSDTPPIGTILGPGDMTWAFQWDVLISPGATFQISKDKNLLVTVPVPEPSTISLAALGLLSLVSVCRRQVCGRA
jgi:PEP-CTERM motif